MTSARCAAVGGTYMPNRETLPQFTARLWESADDNGSLVKMSGSSIRSPLQSSARGRPFIASGFSSPRPSGCHHAAVPGERHWLTTQRDDLPVAAQVVEIFERFVHVPDRHRHLASQCAAITSPVGIFGFGAVDLVGIKHQSSPGCPASDSTMRDSRQHQRRRPSSKG